MRVIDAYELDGQLHVMADCGKGCTHALTLSANATKKSVQVALRAAADEQEARTRRKVPRSDLLGDL